MLKPVGGTLHESSVAREFHRRGRCERVGPRWYSVPQHDDKSTEHVMKERIRTYRVAKQIVFHSWLQKLALHCTKSGSDREEPICIVISTSALSPPADPVLDGSRQAMFGTTRWRTPCQRRCKAVWPVQLIWWVAEMQEDVNQRHIRLKIQKTIRRRWTKPRTWLVGRSSRLNGLAASVSPPANVKPTSVVSIVVSSY